MASLEDPDASKYVFMTHYEEPNEYPMSDSLPFLVCLVIAYLLFVLKIGPDFMKNREPYKLKNTILFYNAIQVILSAIFVITSLQVLFEYGLFPKYCPINDSEARKKILWPYYIYWLGKITELLDTIFFVLRKKYSQVTFLHVYHHSSVVIGSWLIFKYGISITYIYAAFINSLVHVVMYFYYFMAALGPQYQKYLTWKKYITSFQLVQFVSMFLVQLISLFVTKRCTVSILGLIYAFFSTSLFFTLFFNFYKQSYNKTNAQKKAKENKENVTSNANGNGTDASKIKAQ